VPFEFLEYDAVAILGMTGYDASLYDDGMAVEPECGLNVSADGEGHHQFDIAAGATEVGGGEAHGDVIAFLAEFDLDLDGVAAMKAAIALGWSRRSGLGIGRIHESAPVEGCLEGPCNDYRQLGGVSLGGACG